MASISVGELAKALDDAAAPLVIDVRRREAFLKDTKTLGGALRRDPERVSSWGPELPAAGKVVVSCVHGHEVSQGAAGALAGAGLAAAYLEGGIEAWKAAGLPTVRKLPAVGFDGARSTAWITRARPKIDRIACPWLVARFVDPGAEFRYVPPKQVLDAAKERDATPYEKISTPGGTISRSSAHAGSHAFKTAAPPGARFMKSCALLAR